MTHLGQRLSALIDGELEAYERERVLTHVTRCGACQDEVAALRMLKRKLGALGEAAAGAALTSLTGRLMDLSESVLAGRMPPAEAAWPPPTAPAGGWQVPTQSGRPEQRLGKYFLTGSLVVFLAGLGTAAFIAGGEAQAQAPSSPATPSVDVLVVPKPASAPGDRDMQRGRDHLAPTATPSR